MGEGESYIAAVWLTGEDQCLGGAATVDVAVSTNEGVEPAGAVARPLVTPSGGGLVVAEEVVGVVGEVVDTRHGLVVAAVVHRRADSVPATGADLNREAQKGGDGDVLVGHS